MDTMTLTNETISTTVDPLNQAINDNIDTDDIIIDLFDEEFYLEQNPDLKSSIEAGTLTAFEHFQQFGRFEGREFSRVFKIGQYLQENPDVEAVFGRRGCLQHFLDFGITEGREFNSFFNVKQYLKLNLDLEGVFQGNYKSAFKHFLKFGQFEQRSYSSFFSSKTYLDFNTDLVSFVENNQKNNSENGKDRFNLFQHFLKFGQFERREFSSFFNVNEYLSLNADLVPFVEAGVINPIGHFLEFGRFENREFSFSFSVTRVLQVLQISKLSELNISDLLESILDKIDLILDKKDDDESDDDSNDDSNDDGQNNSDDDSDDDSDDNDSDDDSDDNDSDDNDSDDQDDSTDSDDDDSSDNDDGNTNNPPTPSNPANPPVNPANPPTPSPNPTTPDDDGTDDGTDDETDNETDDGTDSPGNPLINFEFVRVTYKAELEAKFSVEITSISNEQILDFLDTDGLELNLNPSEFVDLSYYLSLYGAEISTFYQVSSVQQLTYQQILNYIEVEGLDKGHNPSAFVHLEYTKQLNLDTIQKFFDVESIDDLTNNEVIESIEADTLIDVEYVRTKYAAQLQIFYSLEVTQLTDKQVKSFILNFQDYDEDTGFSAHPIDFKKVRKEFFAELKEFFKIEEADKLTDGQVKAFLKGEGSKLGILKQVVDIEYFKSIYAEVLITEFGEDFTDDEIIEFVFRSELSIDLDVVISKGGIDIEGYFEKYKKEILKFYFEDEKDDDDSDDSDDDNSDDDDDDDSNDDDDDSDDSDDDNSNDDDDDSDDDDSDDGTGNGSDDDSDDDSDDGSELTDRQIIKFMFREGLKLGINVFEFVDVEFLKVEFQAELSKHYSIEIAAVGELDQFLVVDYLYGGFVSEEIDYQFYRQAYATQLEAAFSVEVETLTDLQILEHAYTVGLTEGLALSPIDYEGCLKDFGQEIADYFKLDLKEIGNLDRTQVKFFILEVASEFNLDISQYVDLEYFRRESGNSVIENYRVEQVYSLDYEQTFEFVSAQVGVNTSPLIDLEWYRTEYPEDLAANQAELDADGNGEIDDSELYDALTGEFLEQGNETSPLYNFEEYFNSDEIKGDVATYYNVESFDQLTHAQKLAYMFGQGLLEGNDPFSEEFLAEHPELEFETFLQVNSAALVQFSGVQSIEEVSFTEVYDYQAVNGLLNPGSDAMI